MSVTPGQLGTLALLLGDIEALCVDAGVALIGATDGSVLPYFLDDDETFTVLVSTEKATNRLAFEFIIGQLAIDPPAPSPYVIFSEDVLRGCSPIREWPHPLRAEITE